MRPLTRAVFVALCTVAFMDAPCHAQAQWPLRPLKVVVPIAPGSVLDIAPRAVLDQVAVQLGQAIVVENRAGAGQTIGTSLVAKAEPDGYTLLVNSSAHASAPALYTALDYKPVQDFSAVAALGVTPFVLVVPPDRPHKSARDLVDAAQARPRALNFSSPGIGSASHLSAERFGLSAKIAAVHVPFKGGVEAMTEVIAGRADFAFIALGAALPQVREGKLRALAVNGITRAAALPDVPTLAEAGFAEADYATWLGLFAPAKTPREIVARLHRETLKALQDPKVKERLATLGVEPLTLTPDEFDALVARDVALSAALVKSAGLKVQ